MRYKIVILILCAFFHLNAWMPSVSKEIKKVKVDTPKVNEKEIANKILAPIKNVMKSIENLTKEIELKIKDADEVKSMGDKFNFSFLQDIKEPGLKSKVITIYQQIMNNTPLLPKNEYLSQLKKVKSLLGTSRHDNISKLLEKFYLYKQNQNDLEKKFSGYKDKISNTDQEVKNKINESKEILKSSCSLPGVDKKMKKRLEMRVKGLKSKVEEKAKPLNGLKTSIEEKTTVLNDVKSNVQLKMNEASSVVTDKAQDMTKKVSRNVDISKKISEKVNVEKIKALSEDVSKKIKKKTPAKTISFSQEFEKGLDYFKENNLEKAKEYLQKEISQNPNNYNARNYMSKVYIKEKKFDHAIDEINKALEIFKQE